MSNAWTVFVAVAILFAGCAYGVYHYRDYRGCRGRGGVLVQNDMTGFYLCVQEVPR